MHFPLALLTLKVVFSLSVTHLSNEGDADMFRRESGGDSEQPGAPGPMGAGGSEEGVRRYRMRQKLVSLGDDYWIENAQGSRVYFVDGKAFRLREHLGFQDTQSNELAAIQERVMRIKDTHRIYRKGNVLATVKKVLISPLSQRFEVHVAGGMNMEAEGNIGDHEYEIHEGRRKVAEVSKKWFPLADSYGVDIIPGADDILVLAITVVIDMMLDQGE